MLNPVALVKRHAKALAVTAGVVIAADGVRLADHSHDDLALLTVGGLVVGIALAGDRVTEVILSRSKGGAVAVNLRFRETAAKALTSLSEGKQEQAEQALRDIVLDVRPLRSGMPTSAVSFYELQADGSRLLHVAEPGLRSGERLVCGVYGPDGIPHYSEPLGQDCATVAFPRDFPSIGAPEVGYYGWQWYGQGLLDVRRELPNTAGGFTHSSK